MVSLVRSPESNFQLEEATIEELHTAIKVGQTSCLAVVRHYLARVRKFNGVASMLVKEDGRPVAAANGTIRTGSPLKFPTETVNASHLLPDLDKYIGPPIEFGGWSQQHLTRLLTNNLGWLSVFQMPGRLMRSRP